jgi:UDP-N-acetylglucosamine--N-acetylmuramyl-(pentapeptide) pyrophosphoryl-undecaprenol N-acetylglucosamine transferase
VPAAGLPLRRLALRSLRTVELDQHAVLDPLRLALSVPQATAILAAQRPAAIFTTGGYVAVPVLMAAAPMRIPVRCHRRLVRSDLLDPRVGGAPPTLLRDRDAHPRHA